MRRLQPLRRSGSRQPRRRQSRHQDASRSVGDANHIRNQGELSAGGECRASGECRDDERHRDDRLGDDDHRGDGRRGLDAPGSLLRM